MNYKLSIIIAHYLPNALGSQNPLIKTLNIINQQKDRKYLRVLKEVTVSNDDSYVSLIPNDQFSVDIEIVNGLLRFKVVHLLSLVPLAMFYGSLLK